MGSNGALGEMSESVVLSKALEKSGLCFHCFSS